MPTRWPTPCSCAGSASPWASCSWGVIWSFSRRSSATSPSPAYCSHPGHGGYAHAGQPGNILDGHGRSSFSTTIHIQYLKGSYGTVDLGATMALILLAIIPVIIFYLTSMYHAAMEVPIRIRAVDSMVMTTLYFTLFQKG